MRKLLLTRITWLKLSLSCLLQVGSKLGQVLVLQRLRGSNTLLVSCKPSLIAAAGQLPKELEDLTEASIVPGYVSNAVPEGVFVRFLNGLTGRAGKKLQLWLLLH